MLCFLRLLSQAITPNQRLPRSTYVEKLIYKWQEAKVRPSESNPDTEVNGFIAEREEIDEEILKLQVR